MEGAIVRACPLPFAAVRRLALLATLLLALFLAACGDDDDDGDAADTGADTAAQQTDTAAASEGACPEVAQPPAKEDGGQEKPSEELDASKTYDVTVKTSCGDFTIRLDVKGAPETSASFVALARSGFYDDTYFHRIVPGFVIQGGDPTGTGAGGPGYQTVDAPPSDAAYTKGVVAMAKAGNEAPGTSGSQFFVVTGEDAGLPPEYAVLGEVTDGLDVVEKIGALGDASEQPLQVITIEGTEVSES
jgi:cyclophilin family peptidyl-prolyl cis-trans isomerase